MLLPSAMSGDRGDPDGGSDGASTTKKDLLGSIEGHCSKSERGGDESSRLGGAVLRRNYLRFLGGTVAGISLIPGLGAAESEELVEVVLAEYKGEPQEVGKVPQEWRDHALESRSVSEELRGDFGHNEWLKVISRRPSDKTIGDMRELDITVEVTDLGTAGKQIPDQIGDISIKIEDWVGPAGMTATII